MEGGQTARPGGPASQRGFDRPNWPDPFTKEMDGMGLVVFLLPLPVSWLHFLDRFRKEPGRQGNWRCFPQTAFAGQAECYWLDRPAPTPGINLPLHNNGSVAQLYGNRARKEGWFGDSY